MSRKGRAPTHKKSIRVGKFDGGHHRKGGGGGGGRRAATGTLGAVFQQSLAKLMDKLNRSTPHFVRCIKPNLAKRADHFLVENVTEQLKYTGVMETTEIRRQGYAFRPKFDEFIKQYKMIAFKGTEVGAVAAACTDVAPVST